MITSSQQTDRQQQLRKVAILVTTLGEPLAGQLLADLPAHDAIEVRNLVAELDDISPAEYESVVADFRMDVAATPEAPIMPAQATSPPPKLTGVELDPSLLAKIEAQDSAEFNADSDVSASPWKALSDADAATLVEMLSAEQPQTIAVVLSKLETAQSAELISKLSPELQTEVLTRLSDLDPADEQSLQVVESQLANWINTQRQRHQRMAAGHDLVQRILNDTPDHQRNELLIRLGKNNPTLADKLSTSADDHAASQPPVEPIARPSATNRMATYLPPTRQATTPTSSTSNTTSLPTHTQSPQSNDPLTELEALDDQALLSSLRVADRQTVMLALSGASDSLIKRIVKGLPRRQANQFRKQVRSLGPTRLSEILAAQRQLVRCSQG